MALDRWVLPETAVPPFWKGDLYCDRFATVAAKVLSMDGENLFASGVSLPKFFWLAGFPEKFLKKYTVLFFIRAWKTYGWILLPAFYRYGVPLFSGGGHAVMAGLHIMVLSGRTRYA
jgi:hypothetical protein